ncbi:MAG: hypothetical protein U1F57_10605 [bacterium]
MLHSHLKMLRRWMVFSPVLILLFATEPAVDAAVEATSLDSKILQLLPKVIEEGRDSKGLLAQLQEAKKGRSVQEQSLLDKMIQLVGLPLSDPTSKRKYLNSVESLLKEIGGLYPHDSGVQFRLASGTELLAFTARSFEMEEEEIKYLNDFLSQTERLVTQWPDSSHAWVLRGEAFKINGGQPLAAIRAYAQCLRLDKGNSGCAYEYQRLARDYQQPRCSAAQVNPSFRIYASRSAEEGDFKRKVSHGKQVFYLPENPGLNAKDVREIVLNQSEGRTTIDFTQTGAEKMREFSEQNNGRIVVVALGDKVLTAPMVRGSFKGDGLTLSNPEGSLSGLCLKTETPILPSDAKIP